MKREAGDEIIILTQEQKDRCLDFAKRMVFKGYEHLTDARQKKLWGDVEWFLTDCLDDGYRNWDSDDGKGGMLACDWFDERFEEYRFPASRWEDKIGNGDEPKYYRELCSTCRAAIDIIDDFAGGVWGWTLGDVKRMYDGQLPDWFPKDDKWCILGDGKVAFSEIKDEHGIAI